MFDDRLFEDELHVNRFVEPHLSKQDRINRLNQNPKLSHITGDNQKHTSALAAISVLPKIRGIKKQIIALLETHDGMTCSEICQIINKEKPSVSPRLVELEKAGLVKADGTRPSNTGHQATIYRLT